MSDLREDIAVAGNPSNLWSQGRVRDGDVKLGALGMADALGALLWRLKYRGDAGVTRRVRALMADRLRTDRRWQHALRGRAHGRRGRGANQDAPRLASDVIHRLVFRVLNEWLNERCTTCHGRGSVGIIGAVHMCTGCRGSGRQPAQHAVRWRDLGVTREQYGAHWQNVIESLLTQLAVIDDDVKKTLKSQIAVAIVASNADRKAA